MLNVPAGGIVDVVKHMFNMLSDSRASDGILMPNGVVR